MYGVDAQIMKRMTDMTAQAAEALHYTVNKRAYYEGVPTNYMENRINIFNTRKRQNDLYAFV